MTQNALVLGGGGPVGIAWEAGVMAGLALEGVRPPWHLIVGTSAGSFVGSAIAAGMDPIMLAEAQIALGRQESSGGGAPPMNFDPSAFGALYLRMPEDSEPSTALKLEFGALSKTGAVVPEELFLMAFAGFIEPGMPWPASFACTAVDVDTGTFKLLRAKDNAPLLRGVAASCAVPGIFPPIEIDGARYMDGGVRSATSTDAAAGYDRVLTLAVQTAITLPAVRNATLREARAVVEAGGKHHLIIPDAEVLRTFPTNLMNAKNRAAIAEAGIAQGRREAEALKGLFA